MTTVVAKALVKKPQTGDITAVEHEVFCYYRFYCQSSASVSL